MHTMALFTENLFRKLSGRNAANRRLVRRWTSDGHFPVTLGLPDADRADDDPVTAEIKNLSITGMLVSVDSDAQIAVGASVTLGEGDTTAVCTVTHVHPLPGTDIKDLGLHIQDMSDRFCRGLHESVAALRADHSRLLEPWSSTGAVDGETVEQPDTDG